MRWWWARIKGGRARDGMRIRTPGPRILLLVVGGPGRTPLRPPLGSPPLRPSSTLLVSAPS